jgi:hypothetical protein
MQRVAPFVDKRPEPVHNIMIFFVIKLVLLPKQHEHRFLLGANTAV